MCAADTEQNRNPEETSAQYTHRGNLWAGIAAAAPRQGPVQGAGRLRTSKGDSLRSSFRTSRVASPFPGRTRPWHLNSDQDRASGHRAQPPLSSGFFSEQFKYHLRETFSYWKWRSLPLSSYHPLTLLVFRPHDMMVCFYNSFSYPWNVSSTRAGNVSLLYTESLARGKRKIHLNWMHESMNEIWSMDSSPTSLGVSHLISLAP